MGPPKPTFLEVFMVNNLVFRWPKALFCMVKRGLMAQKLEIWALGKGPIFFWVFESVLNFRGGILLLIITAQRKWGPVHPL